MYTVNVYNQLYFYTYHIKVYTTLSTTDRVFYMTYNTITIHTIKETLVVSGFVLARRCQRRFSSVTPQIRDVTGQRQTYTYASEALTY